MNLIIMNKLLQIVKRIRPTYRVLIILMVLLTILGFAFQGIYNKSPKKAIKINEVADRLNQREISIDNRLLEIASWLKRDQIDSLKYISFEKLPSTYLVYMNDDLIFWSDNQIEPQNLTNKNWQLKELSNVIALTKSVQQGDYNVVAYMPIKHNYPYENEDLQNEFYDGLELNKDIGFSSNDPTSEYAIFSNSGDYLFTFELPALPIYNEKWAVAAMVLFLIAFLIFFYLFSHLPRVFGNTSIPMSDFLKVSISMSVFVFALLIFNIPSSFFLNKVFTPFHYASNTFLRTLTHLSFLSLYIFSVIYLFCYYVKRGIERDKYLKVKLVILQFVPAVYFFLIFTFLIGVVFNSSTEINVQRIEDFSFVAIWNHLLFLIWGIGFMLLHIKIHSMLIRKNDIVTVAEYEIVLAVIVSILGYFYFGDYGVLFVVSYVLLSAILYLPHVVKFFKKTRLFIVIWLAFFTFFIAWSTNHMNRDKKFEKYRTLAENHYLNDETDEDRLAIVLLDDLDKSIISDNYLKQIVQEPDSILRANDYINNAYLRGFWNKYEMRLFAAVDNSQLDNEFKNAISNWGRRVKDTHFYIMGNPKSDMEFIGAYNESLVTGSDTNFYMEFYPRKYYKSYSFPDLLLENNSGLYNQLKLSIARYTFRELMNSSGQYKYQSDASWIEKRKENFYVQEFGGYNHYIYVPNAYNYFILSEKDIESPLILVLYFVYVFLLFICITFFVMWIYRLIHKETKVKYTFSSKFMYSFTLLLVVSFISIFYVSFNYMQQKYIDEHKQKLEQTKTYIQNALQEKYSWREELDSTMSNDLNFDLQDLSYTYQTDIHVYDNHGRLIASSQMPLFTRELISRQISPIPYFSNLEDLNQFERIGNLEYMTAYTDFYNMDYLPIGFIAVPQFFSNYQIQGELEDFLSVIVHIYMIIIVLFVILSVLIGRQLSAPLFLLEESLKKINFGQEIKRVDYKPQDEIRQLVDQYNRTVEELEKSAMLLAKSEREAAWKTMARQVAHEINNPLTPMKLTIQQLQRRKQMDDENFDEYFEKSSTTLIEQIENLSRIAGSFSNFAKLPEAKFVRVDLAKKVSSVAILFANANENIELHYEGPDEGEFVMADREQLIQVFNNLLKNAVQAIPPEKKGRIDIKLWTKEKWIYIDIKDNGKGIPDDVKKHLFTPNFTTKSTGMGLGLVISQNIIHLIGGTIEFETEVDKGTTFKIVVPKVN